VHVRVLIFFAIAFAFLAAPGGAQTPCSSVGDGNNCFNSFSPEVTTGVYDFSGVSMAGWSFNSTPFLPVLILPSRCHTPYFRLIRVNFPQARCV
jgi:hypothetical protein